MVFTVNRLFFGAFEAVSACSDESEPGPELTSGISMEGMRIRPDGAVVI